MRTQLFRFMLDVGETTALHRVQSQIDRYRKAAQIQACQKLESDLVAMMTLAGVIDWYTYACIVYRALSPVDVRMVVAETGEVIGSTRIDLLPA